MTANEPDLNDKKMTANEHDFNLRKAGFRKLWINSNFMNKKVV